jgi:hypothetical protein
MNVRFNWNKTWRFRRSMGKLDGILVMMGLDVAKRFELSSGKWHYFSVSRSDR